MKYSNLDQTTGEFLYTEFNNLRIPKNLGTPDINGVERTVNVKLTRAPGWHYSASSMMFIPAYSERRGIKVPFEITHVKTKGFVVKFTSGMFDTSIPIGTFLLACFPYVTKDAIHSMVQSNARYLTKNYLDIPPIAEVPNLILKRNNVVDPVYAVERFRTLFTKQTTITHNLRLKTLLSLNYFTGCCVAEDIVVYDGVIAKGVCITEDEIFRLEHSGLSSVGLTTSSGAYVTISLLNQAYTDLFPYGRKLSVDDKQYVLQCEKALKPITLGGVHFEAVSLPQENTFPVYCMVLNRLINFELIGIKIDMNSYENQTLSTLKDEIDVFDSSDTMMLDDRIKSSKNMLEGISSITFDPNRVYNAISSEESSLVVPVNNENPYTLLASSGTSKLVKPVKHLTADAIKIRNASQGIEDGTDSFENKNIGKSTPLCVTTKMIDRKLYVPLYIVKDRVRTDDVVDVLCYEVDKLCVGEYNCDLSKPYVLARLGGVTKYVASEQITHLRVSPFSSVSYSRATAVYAHHADAKRSQMAAKTMEQGRSILMPERALVETGIESIVLHADTPFVPFKKVEQVITEYAEEHNIILSDSWYEDNFELSVLKNDMQSIVYKLESLEDRTIFGTFELKNQKTQKGSCTWANIVPSKGKYYRADDYIWRANTVHNKKVVNEGLEALNYHTGGEEGFFDEGVGCGRNFRTMFGVYHTMTVDDASVISDVFARSMSFDTPVMITKEYLKKEDTDKVTEIFGFLRRKPEKGFHANGLPKIGTMVWGTMPLIYKYKTDNVTVTQTEDNYCLDWDEMGEVCQVQDLEDRYRIVLYNVVHIDMSDKLSGRHGNKTTIAKILPRELMPYDLETGEPVDLILNPLSLVSRMNTGQVPEMFVGAKQRELGDDQIKIELLYEEVFSKYVKENQNIRDLTMRTMVDGETGVVFPHKMYVGYMYILRSVHISDDKFHAIGDSTELDMGFLQPVGHGPKNQRGQSVGAYETDLLVSKNCYGIINEANGIMSSDVSTYREVMKLIDEVGLDARITDPGTNQLPDHFVMASACLYIHMNQDGGSFHARMATDDVIGNFQKLSLSNISNDIIDARLCAGMSYFELPTEIVTPVAVTKFNCARSISLYKPSRSGLEICQLTADVAKKIIDEILFVYTMTDDKYGVDMFVLTSQQSADAETGMPMLIKMMRKYPMEVWTGILEQRLEDAEGNTGEYQTELRKLILFANRVTETGGMEQFISRLVPVMPLKYRMSSADSTVLHDISKGYLNVARACSGGVRASLKDKQIYDALHNLLLSDSSEYKSIFQFLFDKKNNGRVRNHILKRRVKHSLRGNLSPADYSHPDELGIPLTLALFVYQPFVNKVVREKFPSLSNLVGKDEILFSEKLAAILTYPITIVRAITDNVISSRSTVERIRKLVEKTCNGRYGYYDRAPALHETSMRGARIYTHKDDTIRIHPLLTAEQNADFDGDQEPFCAVLTEAAVNDVKTKLLPSAQIRRSNDGEVGLRINQDALLGLYLATIEDINPNSKVIFAFSIDQLKERVLSGYASLSDTAILALGSKVYKSTAGRLIVSYIYDCCFKTEDAGDGFVTPYVNKGINAKEDSDKKISITTMLTNLADEHTSEKATDIITALQEFGYRANYCENLTLSLDDFKAIEDVPNLSDEMIESLQSLGTWEDYGLLPDNWYMEMDQQISEFKKGLDIRNTLGKDNVFFKFVDSGAKGKDAQLNNMFGMIGFVQGNNGILPTPILGSYVRGLSQFQAEDMSFEQRANALSTVHGTSAPGVSLRTGSFELGGCIILKATNEKPKYPHAMFYVRDYDDLSYVIQTNTGAMAPQELKNYSYRGKPLTMALVHQMSRSPKGSVDLDDNFIIKFKVTIDPDLKYLAERTFFSGDVKRISSAEKRQEIWSSAKSFINYFGDNAGLAQDYAGKNPVERGAYPENTMLGIKASTALSEPANQMVISKRNLVASDSAYGALDLYQKAIKDGKMFSNDRQGIAILAPEDGQVSVSKENIGTLFTVKAYSGRVYQWMVPVDNEDARITHVSNGDIVFETQILSSLRGDDIDARIHPILSIAWPRVEIDGLVYRDALINPSLYQIQFARFIYYKFLYSLYKDSFSLEPLHFGCFAIQQLRTATILDAKKYFNFEHKKYTNLPQVMDYTTNELIYQLELLKGKETILNTSGAIAAYVFQDPMSIANKAFLIGSIPEVGCTGKLVLGVPQNEDIKEVVIPYKPEGVKLLNIREDTRGERQQSVEVWGSPEEDNSFEGVDMESLFGLVNESELPKTEDEDAQISEIDEPDSHVIPFEEDEESMEGLTGSNLFGRGKN